MRKRSFNTILLWILTSITLNAQKPHTYVDYVNPLIGTGYDGRITPVVSMPFGMIQMGADTRMNNSGYYYSDTSILGFSHVHKSGAGCGDFLDLLFVPLTAKLLSADQTIFPQTISSRFSHKEEKAAPGHYRVKLKDFGVQAELTATKRCGFQKYTFEKDAAPAVVINLKYGSTGACTIVKEDDYDTVKKAHIELVDPFTVRGFRISNGFAPEQHVYFYTKFSQPVQQVNFYVDNKKTADKTSAEGRDVKAVFYFQPTPDPLLYTKTAISPVDLEGAQKNLKTELSDWDFEKTIRRNHDAWNEELARIFIETKNHKQRQIFYTALYHTLMYPMLYSDVDGRFRGPDFKVHATTGAPYYGQVVSIWDTFRGAVPLLTFIKPGVVNDYIRTFLTHYQIFGQLPINVLAGGETFQMLGLHAIPIIADAYFKGIRNYDVNLAFEAMKVSAMKDTSGFSMRYFVGLENYKKYGYVPADLEMEAVARTLEYAYNDWSLAQMAKMLNRMKDYDYFLRRSLAYQKVFDPETKMMRGKFSDGRWRSPFDPFASNHRRDDYCEGNAWQWTFFVPHDVNGLAKLMGGNRALIGRLDTLYSLSSVITGSNTSGDISGLIGQYAHGNEPSHHTAYMYTYLGEPWKTQYWVNKILNELYDNTPEGLCGNDDTGQMSAWYVLSALGFYPVRHGDGTYAIGKPLFDRAVLKLDAKKRVVITATNLSEKNIYVQSVSLNGKPYNKAYFNHYDLINNGKIHFVMGPEPNKNWGIGLDKSKVLSAK